MKPLILTILFVDICWLVSSLNSDESLRKNQFERGNLRSLRRKLRRGARVGTFPLKGTPVFWLPKNATEALNAVKASIAAIQRGDYGESIIDGDGMQRESFGKESLNIPGFPGAEESSDRDSENKNLDVVPVDQTETGIRTDDIPSTFNPGASNRLPNAKHRLITSSKRALMIMKKRFVRRDWCQTEPLKQKIKEEGCIPRQIINRFCYGQCNSFYIPKHSRKKSRVERPRAFLSCSFCKPSRGTWTTVTLSCPNNPGSKFKKRRVYTVKECKCMNEVIR